MPPGKLWPLGRTTQWYEKVLDKVGGGEKARKVLIISATAHPCHWISCLRRGKEAVVYTGKWSNHSKQHGLALGKKILMEDEMDQMKKNATATSVAIGDSPAPFLRLKLPEPAEGEQLLEAHECQQGSAWHDGLNRAMPAVVLDSLSQKLTANELESYGLSDVACQSGGGRTLKTNKALAPGALVCLASSLWFSHVHLQLPSLWFDQWTTLLSFLSLPGNAPR